MEEQYDKIHNKIKDFFFKLRKYINVRKKYLLEIIDKIIYKNKKLKY